MRVEPCQIPDGFFGDAAPSSETCVTGGGLGKALIAKTGDLPPLSTHVDLSLTVSMNDLLGAAGSLLPMVAPARDQYLRWWVFVLMRRLSSIKGYIAKLSSYVVTRREHRRNRWSFTDSFAMAIGAL